MNSRNNFGFAGGSSQVQVDAAVQAFRKFENLMVKLTAEEKAQVFEKTPIMGEWDTTAWGEW